MIDFDGETIKSHHLPLSDIVWVHSTLYDLVIGLLLKIELIMIIDDIITRVAKCHRYGRYICVKISKSWGKKFVGIQNR